MLNLNINLQKLQPKLSRKLNINKKAKRHRNNLYSYRKSIHKLRKPLKLPSKLVRRLIILRKKRLLCRLKRLTLTISIKHLKRGKSSRNRMKNQKRLQCLQAQNKWSLLLRQLNINKRWVLHRLPNLPFLLFNIHFSLKLQFLLIKTRIIKNLPSHKVLPMPVISYQRSIYRQTRNIQWMQNLTLALYILKIVVKTK